MASRIGRPRVFPQIAYDYIVIYWGKDIKYAPFLIFFFFIFSRSTAIMKRLSAMSHSPSSGKEPFFGLKGGWLTVWITVCVQKYFELRLHSLCL